VLETAARTKGVREHAAQPLRMRGPGPVAEVSCPPFDITQGPFNSQGWSVALAWHSVYSVCIFSWKDAVSVLLIRHVFRLPPLGLTFCTTSLGLGKLILSPFCHHRDMCRSFPIWSDIPLCTFPDIYTMPFLTFLLLVCNLLCPLIQGHPLLPHFRDWCHGRPLRLYL
jgi:hypothetical protein